MLSARSSHGGDETTPGSMTLGKRKYTQHCSTVVLNCEKHQLFKEVRKSFCETNDTLSNIRKHSSLYFFC